ncbi:MAG: Kazal-type serine protease inhibitor [Myxococcota bacterium]
MYQPVCGCNGKTYSSACLAASSGVSVKKQGSCKPKFELVYPTWITQQIKNANVL